MPVFCCCWKMLKLPLHTREKEEKRDHRKKRCERFLWIRLCSRPVRNFGCHSRNIRRRACFYTKTFHHPSIDRWCFSATEYHGDTRRRPSLSGWCCKNSWTCTRRMHHMLYERIRSWSIPFRLMYYKYTIHSAGKRVAKVPAFALLCVMDVRPSQDLTVPQEFKWMAWCIQ